MLAPGVGDLPIREHGVRVDGRKGAAGALGEGDGDAGAGWESLCYKGLAGVDP